LKLHFTKYQGTGNDFIIIDNRSRQFDHLDVARLCHPKFGIGADGLMLLQNVDAYDFEMVYYNSDGNTSTMCGNGGRCIADFAKKLQVSGENGTRFIAADGPHDVVFREGIVELNMQDVERIERDGTDRFILDTGSPHYVQFVQGVREMDIVRMARDIRYSDRFKEQGINVNFAEMTGPHALYVRTYERGVENETLSCGTGVTACAIALARQLGYNAGHHEVNIETPGGHLTVKFRLNNASREVWLCGPATKVFEGEIEI
jgi:diaminopimelate epimerase